MPRKFKQTFAEALQVVGPGNAQVLERKAHTAASIGGICHEYRSVLYRIEAEALDQAFRILGAIANGPDDRRARDRHLSREPAAVRLAAD